MRPSGIGSVIEMFLEKKEDRWVLQTIHKGERMVETTLAYTAEEVWLKIGTVLVAIHSGCVWLPDVDVKEIRYEVRGGSLEVKVIMDAA